MESCLSQGHLKRSLVKEIFIFLLLPKLLTHCSRVAYSSCRSKIVKHLGTAQSHRCLNVGDLAGRPTEKPFQSSGRVFANGPGDLGSISGRVIPKTQKMVLDASLLNTQHYKVRIKGKVEQSWERSSALPYTLV